MPQQINLCSPIFLTQKRYFSAQTMAQALVFLAVVGGGLCFYWVWHLNVESEGFKDSLVNRARELEGVRSGIKSAREAAGFSDVALSQELQGQRAELLQREKVLEELEFGLFQSGWGHSARLQLLAQSIPLQVWVTDVKADEDKLEVSGFTLEPVALNDWVLKLATSPLLKYQKLATIKVENASATMLKTAEASVVVPLRPASAAAPVIARPMWSFSLVNAVNKPAVLVGVKP